VNECLVAPRPCCAAVARVGHGEASCGIRHITAVSRWRCCGCWGAICTAITALPQTPGGLMQNHAPIIYPYSGLNALFDGEFAGGAKTRLPGSGGRAVTERPDQSA
jgi:hypothetical protein